MRQLLTHDNPCFAAVLPEAENDSDEGVVTVRRKAPPGKQPPPAASAVAAAGGKEVSRASGSDQQGPHSKGARVSTTVVATHCLRPMFLVCLQVG